MSGAHDKPRGERVSEGGRYLLQPFALPLDWLEVRFRASADPLSRPWGNDDRIALPARYALERMRGATKHWSRVDRLLDRNGRQVATVASCPHNSNAGKANEVVVKWENRTLYDWTWYGIASDIMDGLAWDYVGTMKLDLAADGDGFLAPFGDYMRGNASRIARGGHAEMALREYPGVRGVKAIELGTKASNKRARIYRKARELMLSGKFYIEDYWRANGRADCSEVERCEISVKGKELRRYAAAERERGFLDMLTCPRARVDLFHALAAHFVRFHTGEARSRDRVDLLNWDYSAISSDEPAVMPRAPRVLDLGTNALKQWVRLSHLFYVATGRMLFRVGAREVADASGLGAWYDMHAEAWTRYAPKLGAIGVNAGAVLNMLQGGHDADLSALREDIDAAVYFARADRVAAESDRLADVREARAVLRERRSIRQVL